MDNELIVIMAQLHAWGADLGITEDGVPSVIYPKGALEPVRLREFVRPYLPELAALAGAPAGMDEASQPGGA